MGQRHAGRKHQRDDIAPWHSAQVCDHEAGLRGFCDVVCVVVGGDHFGAARFQRVATRKARATETEHRDRLAGEGGDGDHGKAVPTAMLKPTITAASVSKDPPTPASPR